MKAFHRQLAKLKRAEDIDPKLFQTVAHFLLHGIVKKDLKAVDPTVADFEAKKIVEKHLASTDESPVTESEAPKQVQDNKTTKEINVDEFCKVREIALKILH